MNNEERRLWILNDEGLYSWWISSRLTMNNFIRGNKEEIDTAIKRASWKPSEQSGMYY